MVITVSHIRNGIYIFSYLIQLWKWDAGYPSYSSVCHDCLQRYQQLKQQWEMKSEEAELLQKKLHQSAYHKQEEELLALKKTIGDKCVLTLLTEN